MPCCGQNRAAALAAPPATLAIPPEAARTPDPPPGAAPPAPTSVRVRYVHDRAVRVRGPVSARDYHFTGAESVRSVDSRDAEGLVGTGLFRRVY